MTADLVSCTGEYVTLHASLKHWTCKKQTATAELKCPDGYALTADAPPTDPLYGLCTLSLSVEACVLGRDDAARRCDSDAKCCSLSSANAATADALRLNGCDAKPGAVSGATCKKDNTTQAPAANQPAPTSDGRNAFEKSVALQVVVSSVGGVLLLLLLLLAYRRWKGRQTPKDVRCFRTRDLYLTLAEADEDPLDAFELKQTLL